MRSAPVLRVPRRRGFTLIELFAVVVLFAVLTTIAIAKFGQSKRRTYLVSMKADLRNIATMAETHFTTESSYANVDIPTRGSSGTLISFRSTAHEWSATATHPGLPGITCQLESGGGTQPTCLEAGW